LLNHSDTESDDGNSPIKDNIPPPIPNETPVATPITTPTATPFHKNVVFKAHGTKWYDIPVGMRSVNGDIPFKEWGLRIPRNRIVQV
jgi:hypothetical protein